MLSFKIAARFLKSSKTQTILIVLGIAIGVSVQVFVGSLIGSLQSTLVDKTIGHSSQITLVPGGNSSTIDNWQDMVTKIETLSTIKSVSPAADSSAFLTKSEKSYPVLVRGFDISRADKIYDLTSAIYSGKIPASVNDALIGKDLNADLNLKIGDKVQIFTPSGTKTNLTVCGFYDLNVASLNRVWIITTLDTSQSIFKFGNNVTSIEMQVNDVFKADSIAGDVKKLVPNTVNVLNWKDENQNLLSGLQGQTISSVMIQVFVLVSVVIAIASVLAIKAVQKSREIGILKAMGIKDRTAGQIFLIQGFFLGLAGAILGILLGIGLLASFSMFATGSGGSALINIKIDYVFISASAVIALISSTFASVLPAIRTFRLSPIEVIRNG